MDNEDATLESYYRSGFGCGLRRAEHGKHSLASIVADPDRELDRLRSWVRRELGGADMGRQILEAIDEGVADALAGRQPRW